MRSGNIFLKRNEVLFLVVLAALLLVVFPMALDSFRLNLVGKYLTYAFVALGPANHVAVVNARTFEVEKYLLVGRRVWHLEFTPDQKRIFTSNGVSNDVSVIDVESMRVVKSIPVGRYPWGVAIKE